MAPLPRVIVTRPEPEAGAWAAELAGHGYTAVALPLIHIAPVADPAPLAGAWQDLAHQTAVMFVSAAAVRHFFAAAPAGSAWPRAPRGSPRAWATGPGTARALQVHGVPSACIEQPPEDAPQFDSEALWRVVGTRVAAGHRVLIVRGAAADGQASGRDWLAARLAQAGAVVQAVAAYRRELPAWGTEHADAARAAASDGSAWVFSSSEAVGNLLRLLPGQSWQSARAVATHERIALAARTAGFGVVCTSRPGLDALVAALESIG